jgi:2-(1,2-epoxy-1,2-dihydrophenyl)acetyl-CoA isomerase
MLTALGDVLEQFELDPDVGCIVLTGAGGAFCAGGDVKGMAASNSAGGRGGTYDDRVAAQRRNHLRTSGRLHEMGKPTIASLPGPAAGAGLSLALACDLRIASSAAVLTTAFATVALAGDYGGTWFLTQLVGPAKARELYFLPERIDATEALRLGIVSRVVEPEQLDAETAAVAQRLASGPRLTLRHMKENLNRAITGSLDESLDAEATWHVHTATTADHREAAQAFVEKRAPRFTGR